MPITKSAKKAVRQNKRRNAHNLEYKVKMKSLVKQVRAFIAGKKIKEAKEILPKVFQILDKSAKENVIKKNTASRIKSRLSKAIAKI